MELNEFKQVGNTTSHYDLTEGQPARKPYVRPAIQTVRISNKSDVFGTNCFTSTNSGSKITGCPSGTGIPTCSGS